MDERKMYDFSEELTKFQDTHVRLTAVQQSDMRGRRNRNRDRIKDGLKELEKPAPADDWINQGGYAQKTMTQPPEGDEDSRYDIDMGAVFEEADAKTPATTKGWVRDAIAEKATNLKNDPEVKPKCVRVIYANGYQCDFPIFKRTEDGDGFKYQLAAGDGWIDSDPRSMNAWIDAEVTKQSPDGSGPSQLRRVIRFIKYFAKVHAHRKNRKFPGGLVATALAIECYVPVEGRDDEAVYETLKRLSYRSEHQSVVANGVVVSDQKDIDRIKRLINAAADAVEALDTLTGNEDDLTDNDARKAWKKVFRHSFFDEQEPATTAKAAVGQKSAIGVAAVAALTIAEKQSRAEAAVQDIRQSGRESKPWSGWASR